MNTFETPCCVRGYHIYKDIWTAAVGEILFCVREPTNASDRYAVAVTRPAPSLRVSFFRLLCSLQLLPAKVSWLIASYLGLVVHPVA